MMKKRIKRALRAIGLVKPHQSALTAKRGLPNLAQARAIVVDLHGLLLNREPDEGEREMYAGAMAAGAMSEVEVVRALTNSGEFSSTRLQPDNVAKDPHGNVAPTASSDIGHMIEGLIVARMIGEGAVVGLPPLSAFDRPAAEKNQLVSLIRTLDMLAERPAN